MIQIAALLDLPKDTSMTRGTGVALTSILISALAAGFTSAQITYDFDTSPVRRREDVNMYGMIPDNAQSRTFSFLCLIFMSSSMLIGKCLLLYVLNDWGAIWVVTFMLVDMAVLSSVHFTPAPESSACTSTRPTRTRRPRGRRKEEGRQQQEEGAWKTTP